ncbi:autotransporter assembly complex protein TamA [Cognatilysobacter bugurensis]|uniref:Translocation and assembly module subunit TamA n=1 Tax=Cognatilysobacter bugurensis TaxID=543356 RepID=A0A918T3X0_9GAMM|nr:autotransporter assembly complex family protein [Lysobacter bugurensis]GHA87863.1 outer membrane protein assembly factor [Lysobacter bugurensis]
MPRLPACLIAAVLLAVAGAAQAARITRVDVQGLDEAMTENVRQSLSVVDAIDEEVSERRLEYLAGEIEEETRGALEPFGYYSPTVRITRSGADGAAAYTVSVDPGDPVRVRKTTVAIEGDGRDDRYLREELAEFEPSQGEVFEHPVYESSKAQISRRLAERGYFDADFEQRRVEVTRAEQAADIDLVWNSGQRYDLGEIDFVQKPEPVVYESLLERLVYWEPGTYYHQRRLDRLREALVRLDYFSSIDIQVRPEDAVGNDVPVTVLLTPAKRSVYTAGLSYGTDSGGGVSLGAERRYVNMRGHKALAQLDYLQRRKALTLRYRIPAFAWFEGWYTFSAQVADEQTDYLDSRRIEFVASRSGELNEFLTATVAAHALRERWAYTVEDVDADDAFVDYRYATFTFPSIRAEYIDADSRLEPRNGIGATLMLRGGVEGVGSDATFAQVHTTARWYRELDLRSRLILRGELGRTLIEDPVGSLAPSIRFHAGGDRSIRGYAFREVGPRIGPEGRQYAIGARNVVTGSVEYERYFTEQWGAAVFVDSGSAFNDSPDWRTGVGIGARWRSPVGPVRVDIARGLDDPDSSFQLYLSLGAEL